MTNVKKISRNKPCTCGSGKKWKRCCGKGQEPKPGGIINLPKGSLNNGLDPQVAQKLKNDFRKQVNPLEGIPSDEIIRRDQMVYLAQLETMYNMGELDKVYFNNVIANFEALKRTVQSIQLCPERGPVLTGIETKLVEYTKLKGAAGLNRTNFLTLVALRSVLGQADVEPATVSVPEGETQLEEDKVIEQAMGNSGQGQPARQQSTKPRGDGPIIDDGSNNPDGDFPNTDDDALLKQVNRNLR